MSPDFPLVSVVVPTFDRARLLGRALRSVFAQSYRNYEVIVVDDGSTDDTPRVVAGFGDPRLHYLRLDANGGGAAARNAGIRRARGAYLAFLDSDDEWLPGKLAAQLDLFRRSPDRVGAVYCAHTTVNDVVGTRRPTHPGGLRRGDVRGDLLGGWCPATASLFLVRADVLDRSGPFDPSLPSFQDYDLWLRVAARCEFDFVPQPLVVKHEHAGAQVARSAGPRLKGLDAFVAKWRDAIVAHGGEDLLRDFVRHHASVAHERALLTSAGGRRVAEAAGHLRALHGLGRLSLGLGAKAALVAVGGPRALGSARRLRDGFIARRHQVGAPTLADYRTDPRRPRAPADGGGAPRVSVVTAVRNGAVGLERTMRSVFGQTYPSIEYIVIDGGSTDGTLDIVRRHEDRVAYWISEPDRGISDAFNKGIAAATGEFVALVNADDWLEPDQVERGVAALLRERDAAYAFGDMVLHDAADGRALYRMRGDPGYARMIASRMPELPHPTVLARRAAYERFGLFDLGRRYAMDYDWLLRLHAGGARGVYAPGLVGHMTQGGSSEASLRATLREVREISVRYGYPRWRAWPLFAFRYARGSLRQGLERALPPRLRGLPRRLANPRCGRAAA